MSELKAKDATGCVIAIIGVFVTGPMWLILLFGILSRIDAETWMWGLYWGYVPAHVLIGLAKSLWEGFKAADV